MKINHEANFMNAVVKVKLENGHDTILFEWNSELNRFKSDIVYSAWCGYCLAVLHLTGEIL